MSKKSKGYGLSSVFEEAHRIVDNKAGPLKRVLKNMKIEKPTNTLFDIGKEAEKLVSPGSKLLEKALMESLTGYATQSENPLHKRAVEAADNMRKRSEIRKQIPSRKSVQEGKPDRIADSLAEGAAVIDALLEQARRYQILLDEYDNIFTQEHALHGDPSECETYYDGCNCGGPEALRKLFEERNKLAAKLKKQAPAPTKPGICFILDGK